MTNKDWLTEIEESLSDYLAQRDALGVIFQRKRVALNDEYLALVSMTDADYPVKIAEVTDEYEFRYSAIVAKHEKADNAVYREYQTALNTLEVRRSAEAE